MASISVSGNVSVSSLYTESPAVSYLPFYSNFPANGFRNTLVAYDQFTQEVNIGAVAKFDDANNFATIGYEALTTGYVKVDTQANRVYIGAQTIEINNLTLAVTAGGSSGLHLPLVIGGTLYKIALLLP